MAMNLVLQASRDLGVKMQKGELADALRLEPEVKTVAKGNREVVHLKCKTPLLIYFAYVKSVIFYLKSLFLCGQLSSRVK